MPETGKKDIEVGGFLEKKGFSRRKEGPNKDKRGCVKIPKTQHIHASYCQRIGGGGFFVFYLVFWFVCLFSR